VKTLRLLQFWLNKLPKSFWTIRVLGSVIIQLYAGERTPSVDWTFRLTNVDS